MRRENKSLRNWAKLLLCVCVCTVLASALRALACYVAIDTGPCHAYQMESCTNHCIRIIYRPNNSYCDSRDDMSGGTACTEVDVPCVPWEYDFYEEIYNGECYACSTFLNDYPLPSQGTAHIAVVTGSCVVTGG